MRHRLVLRWLVVGAVLLWAGTAWADAQAPKKFGFEVWADFDYNTNATQQNNLSQDLATTGQKSSMAYTQALKVQYDLNPQGPLNLQGKYDYFQCFYARASFVNTMLHTWTLTPSYLFGAHRNIKFWMPLGFNYTDVGWDKYFTSFFMNPKVFHRLSKSLGYCVEMRLGMRDGWLPQTFQEFYDYTSQDIGASLGGYYFFGKSGYLQARLSYDYVGAKGSNNDASRYSLLLSGEYPVNSLLSFTLYLDLAVQQHDHFFRQGQTVVINVTPPPGTVFLITEPTFPKRLDLTALFGAIAKLQIYKGLEGSLHYYYRRHDSNIATYDFTSHIFGAQLAYRY